MRHMVSHGLSERRSLRVIGMSASAYRYEPAHGRRQWRLSYDGLNQLVVRAVPAQEGDPYLVMRRQGLFAWKVTDLQLGRLY